MSKASDVIAVALQNALRGDGCVRDVPQTCLAHSVLMALEREGFKVVPREPDKRWIDRVEAAVGQQCHNQFKYWWHLGFDNYSPTPPSEQ